MDNKLSKVLGEVQDQVIGVFKHQTGSIEMIIEKNEHIVKTLSIGNFLGLHINHYPTDYYMGQIKMFPDGKTLSQMMSAPFEFNDWGQNNL